METIVEETLATIRSNATVAAYSSSRAMAALALSPLEQVPWVIRAKLRDSFGDVLYTTVNAAAGGTAEDGTVVEYDLRYRGEEAGKLVVDVDYSRGRNLAIDLAIGMLSILISTTTVSLVNYAFIKRKIVGPIERLARFVEAPQPLQSTGRLQGDTDTGDADGRGRRGRRSPEIAELHAISTQLEKTVSQLSEQAVIDPLTGLANRRAFDTALAAALANGRSTALMLVDIDYFKFINDHFGHGAGDRALQELARHLAAFPQGTGGAYRFGGDEFAVLLEGSDAEVLAAVSRLKHRFSFGYEPLDGTDIYYSISAGYALCPQDVREGSELLFAASSALLASKMQGRETVSRYDAGDVQGSAGARLPVREYEQAVAEGRVVHFAQPIVCVRTGRIRAFELLLRVLPGAGHQGVRADLAVEAAIRTGRADDLTRRTLQAALELIEKLEAEGRSGICVSVNLNEAQLMAPGFLTIFDEVFGEADQASGLIVEMMEGDYLGSRALTDVIAALRARRSALAIDDFGKGHSSLLRLFAMPSHIVKLDRALLQYREQDPGLLAGMISALGAGGRLVVVEGVETEEDAKFLRSTGAGLAQGYHFARPMPLEEALHAVVVAGHDGEPPICQPRTGARTIA